MNPFGFGSGFRWGGGLVIGVAAVIYGIIHTVEFIEAVIRLIHRF